MATTRVGISKDPRKKHGWICRWFGEYDPATEKQRRYSKAFERKRDAERFQAAKQAEFDAGATRDRPADISLEEYCKRFTDTCLRNRSQSHRACFENTITQLKAHFGADQSVRRIDRQQAEQFINSRVRVHKNGRGKDVSSWTRAQHLKHCRAMCQKAVAWRFVSENVFDQIRTGAKPTRPWHAIKPAEFQALLTVAPDARWKAIYWVLYGVGLRFGEAFNLLWSDVDFERSRIHVRNRAASEELPPFIVKADGRGGASRERSIPMPKQVADALAGWQVKAPEGVPFVLLSADRYAALQRNWSLCRAHLPREGAKKTRDWQNRDVINNVLRSVKRHARKAGLKLTAPITVHTFRKSYGQNHADNGTPMHVLQQLMGHSNIATTRAFYIQVADASERDAVTRFERLFAAPADAPPQQDVVATDAGLTPALERR
ncbi:MAG: site-specific integrase [Planctomycetes bacterium]|nr:site-specific integrase [Planctomycetota bacterium]